MEALSEHKKNRGAFLFFLSSLSVLGIGSPRSRQFQQTNDLIVEVAVDSIACGDRRMRKRVEASDLRGPEFELSRPLKLYCINLLFLVTKTMK